MFIRWTPLANTDTQIYFIGMGLSGFNSCSLNALEILAEVEEIYVESYTNFVLSDIPKAFEDLEKKIIFLKRSDLEEEDQEFLDRVFQKKPSFRSRVCR